MDYVNMIGFGAALLSMVAYVPQAIKVYKTRHTKDISLSMFLIMTLGVILWLIYELMLNSLPMIVANIFTISLSGYILIMKIKLDYSAKNSTSLSAENNQNK